VSVRNITGFHVLIRQIFMGRYTPKSEFVCIIHIFEGLEGNVRSEIVIIS
jgi:hypothetical protein